MHMPRKKAAAQTSLQLQRKRVRVTQSCVERFGDCVTPIMSIRRHMITWKTYEEILKN